jgi:hypothetical protein
MLPNAGIFRPWRSRDELRRVGLGDLTVRELRFGFRPDSPNYNDELAYKLQEAGVVKPQAFAHLQVTGK